MTFVISHLTFCYNPVVTPTTMNKLFRKQIAIPQDHGSWIFILSPLIIGIALGRIISPAIACLCMAALGAFLLRQPVTTIVKVYSGRRPSSDLTTAWFWSGVYGIIVLLALAGLFMLGEGYITYLAIPGVPIFVWHLWLVSRRAERRQAGVEIIATGVLSLAAPAAYWVGIGHYDPVGWWLWSLTWLQTAASIVYAYLRLEQREWKDTPGYDERFRSGRSAMACTSFNLIITAILGLTAILPRWMFVPYALQWLEMLWGIEHPAVGWKPVRIGTRQLIVSLLWTLLFIICWLKS
jgi:hypothetical protein